MAAEEKITQGFELEEGEELGVTVSDQLIVTHVQPRTQAEGKLQVGDWITEVNGEAVGSKDNLRELIVKGRAAYMAGKPAPRISYRRIATEPPSLALSSGIPPELEKLAERRPGYELLLLACDCLKEPTRRLGLSVGHFDKKVYVTDLAQGDTHAKRAGFQIMDRICVVNGVPVEEKNVCRDIIMKSGGTFAAVVERPDTDKTKQELQVILRLFHAPPTPFSPPPPQPQSPSSDSRFRFPPPPQEEMPLDVQEMASAELDKFRQYRERRRQRQVRRDAGEEDVVTERPRGVLRHNSPGTAAASGSAEGRRVTHVAGHQEYRIHRDTPAEKVLKPVKKS